MEEFEDFFNFAPGAKPKKRIEISGGFVNGRVLPDKKYIVPQVKRENLGTEYSEQYRRAEEEELGKAFTINNQESIASGSCLNDLESMEISTNGSNSDDDDGGEENVKKPKKMDDIYEKYNFNYIPPNLPIISSRTEILSTINSNPVTVLQGATGCGKTTQVPQFILDDCVQRKEFCNIIVTQPRRIAARSIADRICRERKWECGTIIGYQVGLKNITSEDTRITFCTTGVLLEKLIHTKDMNRYTHIILDEVHERDQDMDFLFIVVRRLLATNSKSVKIVLMSATIEAPQFANYFKTTQSNRRNGANCYEPAPIVNVDQKRQYTISVFYLCQLDRLRINTQVDYDEPEISDEMYLTAQKLIMVAHRIDATDQDKIPEDERMCHTILVFLPGMYEIDRFQKLLQEIPETKTIDVIPLHSSITIEEQLRVFRPSPKGIRKVILCTNIAESSITIPDVGYVIDFCLTKNLVTDSASNMSTLRLDWASRNNCEQRAGRAGRVMNGRVYRLVPKSFYEQFMQQSAPPEILRTPLDRVVLKAKLLEMGSPQSILALAMDQPRLGDIDNTVLLLKEMGALLRTCNGQLSAHDGDITFMGRVMANLPVDIRISRMILLGHCFSVLEECIIIGAGLNIKSIFNNPFRQALEAYSKKLRWADGSGSDLFAILRAYRCWISQHEQNIFANDNMEKEWTRRYYLQTRSLNEMSLLIKELTERLAKLGIKEKYGVHRVNWTSAEKSVIIKCVIAGAFYPNYFFRTGNSDQMDRKAYQTLCGRDPTNTIYFSGFNQKYVGPLYRRVIKQYFKNCVTSLKNVHVTFESGNEKIFVTFRTNKEDIMYDEYLESVPGQVSIEVYKALKLRAINQNGLQLRVMHHKEAQELAEYKGMGTCESGEWVSKKKILKNIEMIAIPKAVTKEVKGIITYIESPTKFWMRSDEENTLMENISQELNNMNSDIEPFIDHKEITVGQIVAALYLGMFHRAKVISASKHFNDLKYKVNLMDEGMEAEVNFTDLRQFRGVSAHFIDIPPRVFECRLAEIQPSSLTSEKCVWTKDAVSMFTNMVHKINVCAEIYSVIGCIANVILHVDDINVNEYLVTEGLAQKTEENYMSKSNHILRTKQQSLSYNEQSRVLDYELEKLMDSMMDDDDDIDDLDSVEPTPTQCYIPINLKGPFSPLEGSLYGAVSATSHSTVGIEKNSVNSVLLDSVSQDNFESLIVAAAITKAEKTGKLVARETTIMPKIPGFGAIMAAIFCPYLELMQDRVQSRYVSMLCGLGANEKNEPIFEEHDMAINLDVDITSEDLQWINQIRFSMDSMLFTKPGQEIPNTTENDKNKHAQKIKSLIIKLLEKDRQFVSVEHINQSWGMNKEHILKLKDVYGDRAIFPFHAGLKMSSVTSPQRMEQLNIWTINCTELHRLANLDASLSRPIKCKLCNVELENCPEIRIHLYSRLHLQRERAISYNN